MQEGVARWRRTPLGVALSVISVIVVILLGSFIEAKFLAPPPTPTPTATPNQLQTLAVEQATRTAREALEAGITIAPSTSPLEWFLTKTALTAAPQTMLDYCEQVTSGTRTPAPCHEWYDNVMKTNAADVYACESQPDIGACLSEHNVPLP